MFREMVTQKLNHVIFFFLQNGEFQFYLNDRQNSFVEDGIFYIRPTMLTDDEDFLRSGTLDVNGGSPYDQ